jgi:cobalt-zinc-cadmium efflux system outer membrane protein
MERGGKRSRRIDQAALGKSVTELQLADTTRLLVLDVERAFTDVQLDKLNVALAEDTLKAFNDVVAVNAERVRTGDLAQAELARSRLAALQFQNEVREHQLRLRVARNRLALLIGRGADGESLDTAGDLRRENRQIRLDEVRQQALQTRPDIRALRADQARSVADERLQLATGKVDYTLSGEYHRQEGSLIQGNAYAFYFSTPLPLFNRNQGEIVRARVQRSALSTKLQALERAIENDAATIFGEYDVARELVETIETQMLTQARDVRAATEYSYRRGEASFIEFLDAQRVFNDTMRSYNEARAQYAQSLYALDALTAGSVRP